MHIRRYCYVQRRKMVWNKTGCSHSALWFPRRGWTVLRKQSVRRIQGYQARGQGHNRFRSSQGWHQFRDVVQEDLWQRHPSSGHALWHISLCWNCITKPKDDDLHRYEYARASSLLPPLAERWGWFFFPS